MNFLLNVCGITTAAIAFAAVAPSAVAQENTFTFTCQNVGVGPPEPLGDREGHSISVGQYSCRADSGPLSGGVWTETIVWEWDKTNAVIILNAGVIRKPGATTVVQFTEGKLALTVAEGKVTGAAGSGHGTFPIAVGGAASLAGKAFSYSVHTTAPAQFMLEMKVE